MLVFFLTKVNPAFIEGISQRVAKVHKEELKKNIIARNTYQIV
jgi:hypothetical protein